MLQEKIFVTKPYLPPLNEPMGRIQRIHERNILTNSGPEEQEFECWY